MTNLEEAVKKLDELADNCFPFQLRAKDLIGEIKEHVKDAQVEMETAYSGGTA